MTSREAIIAVLRDWPGSEDRFDRLARKNGYQCTGLSEYEFKYRKPMPQDVIDRYLGEWAASFMSEELSRLTDDELSIRYAIEERMMLETEGKSKGAIEYAQELLTRTEREMARRQAKAGT